MVTLRAFCVTFSVFFRFRVLTGIPQQFYF